MRHLLPVPDSDQPGKRSGHRRRFSPMDSSAHSNYPPFSICQVSSLFCLKNFVRQSSLPQPGTFGELPPLGTTLSQPQEGGVWINTVAPQISKGYIWGLFTRFLRESSGAWSPAAKSGNLSYTPAFSSSSPHFLLPGITSLYPRLSVRLCFLEESNVNK